MAENEQVITLQHKPSAWGKVGVFFSLIGMLIVLAAFSYSYFKLYHLNVVLAHAVDNLQTQVQKQQQDMSSLNQATNELQQSTQEVKSLTDQQQKVLTDWQTAQKNDLGKWYVGEAEYLVRLANNHVLFTQNLPLAITLLQRAQEIIQKNHNANLNDINNVLTANIHYLQSIPVVDTTKIYTQLTALNNQIDQLTLLDNFATGKLVPAEKIPEDLSWWRAGLARTWAALRQIVIVRYDNSAASPVVLPEDKALLYQRIHAQLNNAVWALLHRDTTVYQTSLDQAIALLHQYFAQDSRTTQILQQLQTLRQLDLHIPSISLDPTLALFSKYFAQTGSVQPAQ